MSAEILSEHQLKFKNKEMFTTHNVFLLIAVSVPTSKDCFVFFVTLHGVDCQTKERGKNIDHHHSQEFKSAKWVS